MLLAFDAELRPSVAMTEAPHGTAPALEGKDLANPMAMILAAAVVLHYAGEASASADETPAILDGAAERASRAIHEAVLGTVAAGTRTPDLGGDASSSRFTGAVIDAVRRRLSD